MNIKKNFKNIFASVLVLAGLSFSAVSVLAVDWYGTVDTSGNVGLGVGSKGVFSGGGTGGGWALSNPYGLPSGSIMGIASNLLFWLLAIFAILGVIGFVLSGIYYLLAGADEGNAKKGKEGMVWSIIGIIVGLSGFIIMQAVSSLLGGSSKTF
jgi:hypothetical protein